MSVRVLIPAPLRKYTGNEGTVEAEGATVGEVIESLESKYPGIKSRIVDPDGEIKHFVNVFVNDEDIRHGQGRDTSVKSGDEVAIIPAIAGGWKMASVRVRLTFEKELVQEPVIYQMGKQFEVVTNIRRANVDEDVGWVVLQIDGDESEIRKALEYARKRGVRVDPVELSVIE